MHFKVRDGFDTTPTWYGHVFESLLGAELLKIPESELYYWREGTHEVDYILKTPDATIAIEIKSSRPHGRNSGMLAFSKKYPQIRCEVWDRTRCLQFLQALPGSLPL